MHILFVCTGNTCRSPMAEAIARRASLDRGLTDVTVTSAGTGAYDGAAASDGALLVGMENGLDLGLHRARLLTPDAVAEADVVLTMSPQHLARVVELGGAGKSHLLTAFAAGDGSASGVADPFGGDLEQYRATFAQLDREIRRALDRVLPRGTPPGHARER